MADARWYNAGHEGMDTVDQAEFSTYVEDALEHLYDFPGLQMNPLARLLVVDTTGEARSRVLQRIVLEAIQELRPSATVPVQSVTWRKYRYIYLRYVEALNLATVAEDLGISPRQARRNHREAIEALASVLWDKHVALQTGPSGPRLAEPASGDGNGTSRSARTEDQPKLVEQEVARLESALEQQVVDLGQLVDGVVSTVARLAESKRVALTGLRFRGLSPVSADRGVLREALVNLLILAIDQRADSISIEATAAGGQVDLDVVIAPTPEDGGDTGSVIGRVRLLASNLEQDARVQISRRLVEMQGGDLSIQRVRERAIALRMSIPAARSATILVIDDNPAVIQLFERYLSGSAYHLVGATNGAEALRLAREVLPEVITLDVMMPSQDGWEILQLLRSHPETGYIPVIICSVLRDSELAHSLGATGFLMKPVSRPALLQALLHCRRGTTEPAARPG